MLAPAAYVAYLVRFRLARLGHPLLDRQHARLAEDTCALVRALELDRSPCQEISRLIRDTQRHFDSEDRLMRSCPYPDADAAGHRALHDTLMGEMLGMRRTIAKGLPLHPKQAAQVLDWLTHHTAEADRNLVACLFASGRPVVRSSGRRGPRV